MRPTEEVPVETQVVNVEGGSLSLGLKVPAAATHIIAVVQGGGTKVVRRSRGAAMAANAIGAGVVTIPVLTAAEAAAERGGAARFDIGLLASRLLDVLDGLPDIVGGARPLSMFATGTGAAAALVADARRPGRIGSIISAAGRPDLARPLLGEVRAPTLLVVGGTDLVGVRANCDALRELHRNAHLALIPGGSATLEGDREQEELAHLVALWIARSEAVA